MIALSILSSFLPSSWPKCHSIYPSVCLTPLLSAKQLPPQVSNSLVVLIYPSSTVFLTVSFSSSLSPKNYWFPLAVSTSSCQKWTCLVIQPQLPPTLHNPQFWSPRPHPTSSALFLSSLHQNQSFLWDTLSYIYAVRRGDHKENEHSTWMPWGDAWGSAQP